jgi:HEAT repeat protein
MADLESLKDAISNWSWRNGGLQAVKEIALRGPEATRLLAEEMHRRSEWSERLYLAAALGYGSGEAGVEELRSAAKETGPHTMDLRCAALLALAKRFGSDATDDLAGALSDKTGTVREYAMMCLAAVGSESAYESATSQLRSWLRKPAKQERGERDAVLYLLRTSSIDRIVELQMLLQENQERMDTNMKNHLLRLWPQVFSSHTVTMAEAEIVRTSMWSWFLEGSGRLFDSTLPQKVATYF